MRASPGGGRLKTWIALLRGINVVGRRKLLMKDLAAIFEHGGLRSVRTYIQSGNVVPAGCFFTEVAIGRLTRYLQRKGYPLLCNH